MIRKILYLLVGFLIFSSCDKAEIELPGMPTAIFTFSGDINGVSEQFIAGEDNTYLFTDSYIDANGVNVFYGRLGDVDVCTDDCPRSLTIEFRNSVESTFLPTEAVAPQVKEYYNGLVDTDDPPIIDVEISFINQSYANENISYVWNFSNGLTTDLESPGFIQFYVPDAPNNGMIEATLVATTASGCVSTITKSHEILAPQPSYDCPLTVFADFGIGPAGNQICGEMSSTPLVDYTWFYLGNETLDQCLPLEDLAATAEVTGLDANGCSASRTVEIIPSADSGDFTICSADFNFEITEAVTPNVNINQNGWGSVNIKYIDENGIIYQSGLWQEQGENEFTILSSNEYDVNENGQRTQLINFEFDVWLRSEQDDYINIKNASGTWAIALE